MRAGVRHFLETEMKIYRYSPILLPLITASIPTIAADEVVQSAPLIVTATRHEFKESEAPYPAELYSEEDIEQSGATTLYDFLNHNTSITVLPSYGNPLAQKIDMRGYGIGDGYQNIVVTVDGRRINNIDMVPQLLSSIPISNIERIEITKGSGSVVYGDGATAGAIHIHTKDESGMALSFTSGSNGMVGSNVSAGFEEELFSVALTADSFHHDGFSDVDINGKRDSTNSNNLHGKIMLFPTDTLELRLMNDISQSNTRYRGELTAAQFDADPAQNGGNTYKHQLYQTDNLGVGVTADLSDTIKLVIDHADEDKHSDYNTGAWVTDYKYSSNDIALNFDQGALNIVTGLQSFNGKRIGSTNTTHKDNTGYYIQSHYKWGSPHYPLVDVRKRSPIPTILLQERHSRIHTICIVMIWE